MTRAELLSFLRRSKLAVEASVSRAGAPQAAVVGIAVTDDLEIVFDTLESTRKAENLRVDPRVAFVVGWDEEATAQIEGVVDFPTGAELERIREAYFVVYPDGRSRLAWEGITHARVRPTWARFSDFKTDPPTIVEMDFAAPSVASSPIRAARAADAPVVAALLGAQLGEHGVELGAGALRSGVDGLIARPERGLVLVAEADGAVVGVACVAFIWTLEHGGASAWLDELYVAPAHRGKGLGEALLRAVVERSRSLGHAAIDLEIEAGHDRVASLYRRHGFTPHTRSRWVKRLG